MDEYEANLIAMHCSPSPVRRSVSPQSVASYSQSQKMVKSCKNCKFSFRTEFKPNAVYCSKDCETSYQWFLKKTDACSCAPAAETQFLPDHANKSPFVHSTTPNTTNTTPSLPDDVFEDVAQGRYGVRGFRTPSSLDSNESGNFTVSSAEAKNAAVDVVVVSEPELTKKKLFHSAEKIRPTKTIFKGLKTIFRGILL